MSNASLIVETAVLLLLAFLAGCVLGHFARRLSVRSVTAAPQAEVAPAPAAPPTADQLVRAPIIAPILTHGAQRSVESSPAAVRTSPVQATAPEMRPARKAGETTSGRLVGRQPGKRPAPPVSPVQPDVAVIASEVPPIDEAAHVLSPAPKVAATAPPLDAETAARHAVEGGWSPTHRKPTGPAPLPEAEHLETAEAEAAMATARVAVAAASAAAAAALAEHQDKPDEAVVADAPPIPANGCEDERDLAAMPGEN